MVYLWNIICHKKEVLIYTTIWMNLEIIMLSERSQTQRPHIWLYLYKMSRIGKSIEIEIDESSPKG